MDAAHIRLGRIGEDAVRAHYLAEGWETLARNWRCPQGELDLVMQRDDVVVFCEVKTRSGHAFGGGVAAVTPAKQTRIRRLAAAFLAEHRCSGRIRFDVASVVKRPGRAPEIELYVDAF